MSQQPTKQEISDLVKDLQKKCLNEDNMPTIHVFAQRLLELSYQIFHCNFHFNQITSDSLPEAFWREYASEDYFNHEHAFAFTEINELYVFYDLHKEFKDQPQLFIRDLCEFTGSQYIRVYLESNNNLIYVDNYSEDEWILAIHHMEKRYEKYCQQVEDNVEEFNLE